MCAGTRERHKVTNLSFFFSPQTRILAPIYLVYSRTSKRRKRSEADRPNTLLHLHNNQM